jgi:hypothetical protein
MNRALLKLYTRKKVDGEKEALHAISIYEKRLKQVPDCPKTINGLDWAKRGFQAALRNS